jgi:general secretion pathway protein A
MTTNYRMFFELQCEPFTADLPPEHIMRTEALSGVEERVRYVMRIGAAALVTGEIGSGKSTALRHLSQSLHPAEYLCLHVTATSGSVLELYRQIIAALGLTPQGISRARMLQAIRHHITDLTLAKKLNLLLIIDEASLLRMEVLSELHTLLQFEQDAKPWLPLVLCGQNNLIDNLSYPPAKPLASRVAARAHLEGIGRQQLLPYLQHHLAIAGVTRNLFEDAAVTAIHQGAGGLLRKANHLARGALIVAAGQKSATVNAEHVRIAATELL